MDETIEIVIETPRGSRNKYALNPCSGRIELDRVLHSSVHYPADYGVLPDTRAEDGGLLDVLVVVEEPSFPGCRVRVRPVGVLDLEDEAGRDHKILAVPVGDPRFAHVRDLSDLSPHWLREIETFFGTYKLLEGKLIKLYGWQPRSVAWELIAAARDRGRSGQGSPAQSRRP